MQHDGLEYFERSPNNNLDNNAYVMYNVALSK